MKAIVIGASGGIGAALCEALSARGVAVTGLSRASAPSIDLLSDQSIARAAAAVADRAPFDLVIVATGILHGVDLQPEKSFRQLDGNSLELLFRVNAIGPAMIARHFLPLLHTDRRAIFAALSARVGSIGANRLGGWLGYRASKAALNQMVRTLSIELARSRPQTICIALHPGTVDTALSAPFQRGVPDGDLLAPAASANRLLDVIDGLSPGDSGGCFDHRGMRVVP